MTQVQDMTNEKLDFAIADLLGWVNAWDGLRLVWLDGKTSEFRRMVSEWSPSTDPVAADEVQAKAIEVNADRYVTKLTAIVEGEIFWSSDGKLDPICVSWLLNATPRQRAEAAYLTLSQREDE